MATVKELEREMQKLSHGELDELRDWLEEYLEEEWDRQIEADSKAGRLDHLAEKALEEHRQGKTTPL